MNVRKGHYVFQACWTGFHGIDFKYGLIFGGWILGKDSGGECRIFICIYTHGEVGIRGQPATDGDDFPSGTVVVRMLNPASKEGCDMIASDHGRQTLALIGNFGALDPSIKI